MSDSKSRRQSLAVSRGSSRSLFTEAFEAVDSIKLDPGKDQRMRMTAPGATPGPLVNLRAEVLRLIAARDFKLAESLREKIKEPSADKRDGQATKKELSEREGTGVGRGDCYRPN